MKQYDWHRVNQPPLMSLIKSEEFTKILMIVILFMIDSNNIRISHLKYSIFQCYKSDHYLNNKDNFVPYYMYWRVRQYREQKRLGLEFIKH